MNKKSISPLFLLLIASLSLPVSASEDITIKFINNSNVKLWLAAESHIHPRTFFHVGSLGWIQPKTSGQISIFDAWFPYHWITPEVRMGIGFRSEQGDFQICKNNFFLNRSIQITLTGGEKSIVEPNIKCEFSFIDELPEKFMAYRFENQNVEYGNDHQVVALDPITEEWKVISMAIGGNQSFSDDAFPLSEINPKLNPRGVIQFAINKPRTDKYIYCALPMVANGRYRFLFKNDRCTLKGLAL